METYLGIAAAVASMVLVAVVAASGTVAVLSEPWIQEIIFDNSAQLWEDPIFMRIAEMVGLI